MELSNILFNALLFSGVLCLTEAFTVKAKANVMSADGLYRLGVLHLETSQTSGFERTRVYGLLYGLPKGYHGFHVHENGRLTNMCNDAGPHFNPQMMKHGGPLSSVRHVGDLGNIYSDGKVAKIDISDNQITLYQQTPFSIVGRAVVVHANPDDFGQAGTQDSMTTGSAGRRLGCGIIQLSNSRHRGQHRRW